MIQQYLSSSFVSPLARCSMLLAALFGIAPAANAAPDSFPLIGPIAFLTSVVVIVALLVWAKVRRTRLVQENVRLMIERGQPVPPELLGVPRPASDLRRGIMWSALGLGIVLCFLPLGFPWSFGLVPLLVGVGYLAAAIIQPKPRPDTEA